MAPNIHMYDGQIKAARVQHLELVTTLEKKEANYEREKLTTQDRRICAVRNITVWRGNNVQHYCPGATRVSRWWVPRRWISRRWGPWGGSRWRVFAWGG